MKTATDTELLQLCSDGNADAFGIVVQRYQNLVCSVAYNIVGDFARSEDIGQETFVTAWNQLAELKDRSKFRPWIASIARNRAVSFLRSERRSQSLDEQSPASTIDDPAENTIRKEERELVWTTLQRLPDTYREPLVLFYRQDCSVADVAKSLDLSESAVKQRLSRGRQLLRSEVADVVERTLRQSVPGAAFTLAVMGGISGFATATASTAVVGAAGKSTAPIVVAAAKTGAAAGWLGALFGIAGAMLGPWIALKNARYQSERTMIVAMMKWVGGLSIVFCLPFLAMQFGWQPWRMGNPTYAIALITWILSFQLMLLVVILTIQRKLKNRVAVDIAAGTEPLPPSQMRRWMDQWEPRNYTSSIRLLGLPLVQIATTPRGTHMADQSADAAHGPRASTAKAWIAVGDRAYGVILAMGSFAVGGIAIGAMSVGGIAIGGLGVGLVTLAGGGVGVLSMAGLSLGVFANGGLAMGILAFGGMAIAWKGAVGGFAVAREFAMGGGAIARHANDETAKQFVEQSDFFQRSQVVADWMGRAHFGFLFFFLLSMIPVIVMWLLMYRRTIPGAPDSSP